MPCQSHQLGLLPIDRHISRERGQLIFRCQTIKLLSNIGARVVLARGALQTRRRIGQMVTAALLAFTIQSSEAATRFLIDTIDNGIAGKAQILISDGRIRLTHSATPRQEILFSASDRQVLLIRHPQKELTRVDPDAVQRSVNQVAGIAAQLQAHRENLTEEKRAQLDAMLKNLGIADPGGMSTTALTITATGHAGQAGGRACQWWAISQGEKRTGRTCLANNETLAIDNGDFATLLTLATYVHELQRTAGTLLSTLGFSLPPIGLADGRSIPIRLEDAALGLVATLSAIDHLDVSLRLLAPSGYRVIEMSQN